MRRIYYTFALTILLHPLVVYGSVFMLGAIVFADLVHVAMVWQNLLVQPVGSVPTFVLTILSQGEIVTLVSLFLMIISAFMLTRVGFTSLQAHNQQPSFY